MRVILHIPHCSTAIPDEWRSIFHLSDEELAQEIRILTDHFTDELFEGNARTHVLKFPVSRLLVDPERFEDDSLEPMARRGMGAIYSKTHDGKPLKSVNDAQELLTKYYFPHHVKLESLVDEAIGEHGACLIIDCHSFPSSALPCDIDQSPNRPDFCIGTDDFHTPDSIVQCTRQWMDRMQYTVDVNRPYAGTLVPSKHLSRDKRGCSVMIEINRRLYMDEPSGQKLPQFSLIKSQLSSLIELLSNEFE